MSARALNIMNDGSQTAAQKSRALADEYIPFAATIHRLQDAIEGTAERIRKSNEETARYTNRSDAAAQRDQDKAQHNLTVAQAQATAASYQAIPLTPGAPTISRRVGSVGAMEHAENMQMQAARDRATASERAEHAQRLLVNRQRPIAEQATAHARDLQGQSERAQRELERLRRAENGGRPLGQAAPRIRYGEPGQPIRRGSRAVSEWFGGIGEAAGTAVAGPQRNRAGIAEAADTALQRQVDAHNALNAASQQNAVYERQGLELDQRRTAAAQDRLNIERQRAEILGGRVNRMEQQAVAVGMMSRGERQLALHSLERVRRVGTENAGAVDLQMARLVAPQEVHRLAAISGEQWHQQNRGRIGDADARDWRPDANGRQASIESLQQQLDQMNQAIRQAGDTIARQGVNSVVQTLEQSNARVIELLDTRFRQITQRFERALHARNNAQN